MFNLNSNVNQDFLLRDLKDLEEFSLAFATYLKHSLANEKKDIFLLFQGGLAAGKTTTISKILKALGVKSEISSPTFMGLHEYQFSLNSSNTEPDRAKFYHLDLYQKNIDLDSVLELMDSELPLIWALEWSENLNEEILDFLHIKNQYITTLTLCLKAAPDGTRDLIIRGLS